MTTMMHVMQQEFMRIMNVHYVLTKMIAVGTKIMMKINVAEKIKIENPTPTIEKWCRDNLIIDNPDYYKKEKMGKWTGNTPKTISLFEKVGSELWIPFGCVQNIWKMCMRGVSWNAVFCPIRAFDYDSHINLYSYQEKAVNEALKRKNGILVMPCGSGKTQSGLEVISRIGGRALWLTHTQDLLNQSKKRAESVLGNVGCGTITDGKVDIGIGITFATVQTLCKIDLTQYRDYWDVIICDECQHCAGSPTKVTQFYKVMSSLCARYKIGLTATPKRSDGLEVSMFALLGGIMHEVSREEVAHTTCPIKVQQIDTRWYPTDDILGTDGTIDYMKVIDSMIHDDARFDVIMNRINEIPAGESIIVLANRVEYLQKLCDTYVRKSICLSGMGQSKKAKQERKEALQKLNDGELDCIFATYQLAKEGLDVPALRYVILATPEKDETTIIQSAGRVGRKADGKDAGHVIDFVDSFGMYKGWATKRRGYYKKIGAEIE